MSYSHTSQLSKLSGVRGRKRLFLTGATGLLGEYLIRDLTAHGISLSVLTRGSRQYSAKQRIETICRRWERLSGRSLPRPVVLEGHLGDSDLGLTAEARAWVREHCDGMLHNAASLQFVGEEGLSGEPWVSNLDGTRNVLDFSRASGLVDFFQVSTAYVCGTRTGTVLESETDVGQPFGNDYEASKCAAEVLLRQRQGEFRSVTVLRPAIITGDFLSGYTSTFHGLYAPLKIVASLLGRAAASAYVSEASALQALGLNHNDMKNFVPVDWVSAMITGVITQPHGYGQTYHLTAEHRTPCDLLATVMQEVLEEHLSQQRQAEQTSVGRSMMDLGAILGTFRDQMEIYRAYWRNDPVFDRSNSQRLYPELPAPPAVDRVCLRRLCRYALRNNFGWPRPNIRPPQRWSDELLSPMFGSQSPVRSGQSETSPVCSDLGAGPVVNLRVLGEGGGDYHMISPHMISSGNPVALGSRSNPGESSLGCQVIHGLSKSTPGTLTLSSETLERLLAGQAFLRGEISCGRVVCQVGDGEAAEGIDQNCPDWLIAVERNLAAMSGGRPPEQLPSTKRGS
jgi:thioester reductase-like protein